MANTLDEEALEEFKEAFALYDKNKDGRVNAKELQELMRYMGNIYADGEIMDLMRQFGGGDSVDLNGFLNMMSKTSADGNVDDIIMAFRVFDKDGNGTISITELRFVMTCLGDKLEDELVEAMLNQADPAGTSSVYYESFVRNMMKLG